MRIITCLSVAIILIASVVINSTVVARADQQGKGKEPAKSAPAQNSKEEDKQSSEQVEKIIAGPAKDDPTWVSFAPSSELTASMLAPGLSPTFSFKPPDCGILQPKGS